MPKKPAHPPHDHGEHDHGGHEPEPQHECDRTFRGRKISIQKQKGKLRLAIDGEEIPVEYTGRGYMSHAAMFQEFGSLEELAEALIRDWGTTKIKHSKQPHPPHH